MTKDYYIVTGTSSGLGASLAKRLLQSNRRLVCLSRTENSEVVRLAQRYGDAYIFIPVDLSVPENADRALTEAISGIPLDRAESVTLINNAATVMPLAPIEHCSREDIAASLQTNLVSPAVLISAFIRLTSSCPARRNIVNITSGSATHPAAGMSLYCAAKAGLNMLTRCVGMEQGEQRRVNLIAIDPGMMDTPMQEAARTSDAGISDFFRKQYRAGRLNDPDAVAAKIISMIGDHEPGDILSV